MGSQLYTILKMSDSIALVGGYLTAASPSFSRYCSTCTVHTLFSLGVISGGSIIITVEGRGAQLLYNCRKSA